MTTAWKATHKIVFTPAKGKKTTFRVMLVDGCGYSREEWDACGSAAWVVSEGPHGEGWYCEGQVTPGGENGTVEVVRLAPR